MDGPRFDELTRALGAAGSRRTLLRATVSAAIGVLGLRRAATADAQACVALGARCGPTDHCCSGECHGRRCRCRPDQQECGGACFDPCPAGLLRDATCACACPGGTVSCAGECRGSGTFEEDVRNCGACGNRCAAGPCERAICLDGECGVEVDPALVGTACAPTDLCFENGVCGTDGGCAGTPKDCGNCRVCQGGQCFPRPDGSPCLGGAFRCCGGFCIEPCGPDQECCGGACHQPCPTGATRGDDCACVPCPDTCGPDAPCCQGRFCDAHGLCRTHFSGPGEACVPGHFDCPYGYACSTISLTCDVCESGTAGCEIAPGVEYTQACPWQQAAACCPYDPITGAPGFGICCAPEIPSCQLDPALPPCAAGWVIAGGVGRECFEGWQ